MVIPAILARSSAADATLAKARSRQGEYGGAQADMARAERAAREQGDSESGLWISYVGAELAWLRGDIADAGRIAPKGFPRTNKFSGG